MIRFLLISALIFALTASRSLKDVDCSKFKRGQLLDMNTVLSDEEKEERGWMFRCKVSKIENFKDRMALMKGLFENVSESIEQGFGKCFKDIADDTDWRPFYEMYKCLSEDTQKMKVAYEPIEKMQNKCDAEYIVREISIEDPDISKENKESYGCYAKCVHEGLGSFKNGDFYPQNFAKSFTPEIQEIIIKTIKSCRNEVDKKFQGKAKNTCEYFFHFNLCTHQEEFMTNL